MNRPADLDLRVVGAVPGAGHTSWPCRQNPDLWFSLRPEEVERAREEGVERTILFNLCGHGNFDMSAYDAYLSGAMVDHELPQEDLDRAAENLAALPQIP